MLLFVNSSDSRLPAISHLRSSPVGVYPRPENCVFVPIPCELRFNNAERSGRAYLHQNLLTLMFRSYQLFQSTSSLSLSPHRLRLPTPRQISKFSSVPSNRSQICSIASLYTSGLSSLARRRGTLPSGNTCWRRSRRARKAWIMGALLPAYK